MRLLPGTGNAVTLGESFVATTSKWTRELAIWSLDDLKLVFETKFNLFQFSFFVHNNFIAGVNYKRVAILDVTTQAITGFDIQPHISVRDFKSGRCSVTTGNEASIIDTETQASIFSVKAQSNIEMGKQPENDSLVFLWTGMAVYDIRGTVTSNAVNCNRFQILHFSNTHSEFIF